MLSNRPYLLRAFYQWILDSNCTPILVIDTSKPRCNVPKEYIEEGEIVFNVSPSAVRDFKINNDLVEFKASFSGVVHIITAPIKAIMAVYAEENNEGLFFDANEDDEGTGDLSFDNDFSTSPNPSSTTIANKVSADANNKPTEINKIKPFLKLVE